MTSISNKTLAFLVLIAFAVLGMSTNVWSWGRAARHSQPTFLSSGNRGAAFSVTVTTNAAVLAYTADEDDREILFQNTDGTYYIYCGTHSAVATSSGARFYIPPKPGGLSTNGTYNIYCIADSTGSIELIGIRENDTRD